MNKFLLFVVLFGFVAIQTESAITRKQKSAPANAVAQEGELQKAIVAKTQEVIKGADEILAGNLPNSQQVIDRVQESGQNVVNLINNLTDKIKKGLEEHKGSMDETLTQISNNLKTARDNVEQKLLGADGQKKAKEIRDAIKSAIKDAATQVGRLGDEIHPEAEKIKTEILAGAKTFLDNAEKVTNDFKAQIAESQAPK